MTTDSVTHNWRDIADRLTPQEICSMERSEDRLRDIGAHPDTQSALYEQAEYMAECSAVDAEFADVPLPPGATVDHTGWGLNTITGQWNRAVEWAKFPTSTRDVDVYIAGMQTTDGKYTCDVELYAEDCQLTAAQARQAASALLAAADELDRLKGDASPAE